jgi:tryptophan synthase alpha subunit
MQIRTENKVAACYIVIGALADGVIVGSACVKIIEGSENPVETARKFAKSFQAELRKLRKVK